VNAALRLLSSIVVCALLAGCSDDGAASDGTAEDGAVTDSTGEDSSAQDGHAADTATFAPLPLRVITFNTGTSTGLPHDKARDGGSDDDGYTLAMSELTDEHFGNSVSYVPAEDALQAFLAAQQPDIVALQEMYWDPWCAELDLSAEASETVAAFDHICKGYAPDRPWQLRRLFGPDYTLACNRGKPDKCVAVRTAFATIEGCDAASIAAHPESKDDPSGSAVCLDGLDGPDIPTCGKGARMAHAVLLLADGRRMSLVNLHGSSGLAAADTACRRKQMQAIFAGLADVEGATGPGSAAPLVTEDLALLLGDINTDPVLFAGADQSADYWAAHVPPEVDGSGAPVQGETGFVDLALPPSGEPTNTYFAGVRIDHVAGRGLERVDCEVPGETPDVAPVYGGVYFDHKPVVCDVKVP
jgi:hypothetical protein